MPRTRFSERRVFRSSIHIHLGNDKSRNGAQGNGHVETRLGPASKVALLSRKEGKVPEFVIKPRRQLVSDGGTARFRASFDGPPSTTLTWLFNKQPVRGDNKHKIFEENGCHHLHITMATVDDQGIYTCALESNTGTTSATAELEVLVKPQSTESSRLIPPAVDMPLEDRQFPDKTKDATLSCKFHNALDGRASWYKDGKEVSKWQAKSSFDGRTATIVISDVSKRSCGTYECVVKNSGGDVKTKCSVSLLDSSVKLTPPRFTVPLTDQTVQSAATVVLVATVTGSPHPSLKWYRDNLELVTSKGISMDYQGGQGHLTLNNVTKGSKVTCVAQNSAGQDETQSVISVSDSTDSKEPPIFIKELRDMEVKDSDRVEMSVEVKGSPPIDVVWVHNNREIPPTDPVCRMVADGNVHTLVIPEVFPEDAGEYVCEAYNDYGDTDTFCKLSVHEAKDHEDEIDAPDRAPEFIRRPLSQLTVAVGTSAILTCEVDGEPLPSVQWFFGSTKVRHGSKYKTTSVGEQHTLEITSVSANDSGQYTCTLANPLGKLSSVSVVTVADTTTTHNQSSGTAAFASVHQNSVSALKSSSSELKSSVSALSASALKSSTAALKSSAPSSDSSATSVSSTSSALTSVQRNTIIPLDDSVIVNASVQSNSLTRILPVQESAILTINSSASVASTPALKADSPTPPRASLTASKSTLNGHDHTKQSKTTVDAPIADYRSVLRSRKQDSKSTNSDTTSDVSKPRSAFASSHTSRTDSGILSDKSSITSAVSTDSSVSLNRSTVNSKFTHKPETSNPSLFNKNSTTTEVHGNKTLETAEVPFDKFGKTFTTGPYTDVSLKTPSATEVQVDTRSDKDTELYGAGTSAKLKPAKIDLSKPGFDKKTGVDQVDFRSVLKYSGAPKTNEILSKTVAAPKHAVELNSIRGGSRKPSKQLTLSEKRQLFESEKTDKTQSSSITNGNQSHLVKSGNLDRVKQKFDQKPSDGPVTDFRNVLKQSKQDKTQNSQESNFSTPVSASVSGSSSLRSGRAGLKLDIPPKSKSGELFKQSSAAKAGNDSSVISKDDKVLTKSARNSVNKLVSRLEAGQDSGKARGSSGRAVSKLAQKMDNMATDVAGVKSDVRKALDIINDHLEAKLSNNVDDVAAVTEDAVVRPKLHKSLGDTCVEYGNEVRLECEMATTSDSEINWLVNDKKIKPSKYFQMSYSDNVASLVITEAFSEDEGEYTCTATNSRGSATTTCSLQVQKRSSTPESTETDEPFSPTATPPKIYNISPMEFCILRGSSIEFKASYTSVPKGIITWSRNKEQLLSGDCIKIETTEHFSTLTLSNIQPRDSGRYNVTVQNDLGTDAGFASLTVQDVPDPPVGQPCVSEVNETSVTLSWSGPAYDGGCPVNNYRIELCDAEDREWLPVTTTCEHTSYQIENLTPHTPYFFRVFAENKHGVGQPCQTKDVTVTKHRRPSLQRLHSTESDDVFTHESNDVCTPMSSPYDLVSPLSPDEIPFEHRAVNFTPGRKFEESYNTHEEIGRGKFGCVYKCEEKATGKIWAAKVLKCREAEKQKIRQEVEIMNHLQHPKILLLWDVFEAPRKVILIMEYIGGGELFERVLDDDFDLLERDCVQFLRQIMDAVHYMHGRNILHLDLKPENILCVKNESNKVKIIDFGLARMYKPGESVRVLFGTPEFIAPEVVNYDEIGFATDMWSIGVVCYVLLTGLSPFMGDSDTETLSNVTQGEYDFDDESFEAVSDDGKNFIEQLLVKNKRKRMTSEQALKHRWLAPDKAQTKSRRINTNNLKRFILRRKWQKTGNAIRALGRMTSLQKLCKTTTSASSGNGSPSSLDSPGYQSASPISQRSWQGSSDPLDETDAKDCDISDALKVDEVIKDDGAHVNSLQQLNGEVVNKGEISCQPVDGQRRKMDINANDEKLSKSVFVKKESIEERNMTNNEELTRHDVNETNVTKLSNTETNTRHTSGCPRILKAMIDSKAFPGDAVRFDIEYDPDVDSHVTWYCEDEIISQDSRHSFLEPALGSRSLVIKDVCESDDGEYTCRVTNNAGEEDTCSAELIIYGAI